MIVKTVLRLTLLLVPFTVAAQQNHVLLVLNKAENSLVFVDAKEMKLLKKLPTGEGPHEVVISSDNKLAFVANYGAQKGGNTIGIYDVQAQTHLKTIDLGALQRPHGMMEMKGKVYITCEVNRVVARLDIKSEKIDWIGGTGESASHMLALTPDGMRVYTANILSNTVTAMNIGAPPTPQHIKHIPVGPKPEAIEITPDGKQVWVGHNETGFISIIEVATNKVLDSVKAGKMPIRIKFTPDGSQALVSDPPAGEIVLIDVATRKVTKRLKIDGAPVGLVISPDGKFAYVAQTQENAIAKISLADFRVVGSCETGANPDGTALAVY